MATMLVWIVWSDEPVAVFSSEDRARAYIARHQASWRCSPACINPEGLGLGAERAPRPKARRSLTTAAASH